MKKINGVLFFGGGGRKQDSHEKRSKVAKTRRAGGTLGTLESSLDYTQGCKRGMTEKMCANRMLQTI